LQKIATKKPPPLILQKQPRNMVQIVMFVYHDSTIIADNYNIRKQNSAFFVFWCFLCFSAIMVITHAWTPVLSAFLAHSQKI